MQRTPRYVPLLALILTLPLPALCAAETVAVALAEVGSPQAQRTLAELASGSPEVTEIADLVAQGKGRKALKLAEQAWATELDRGFPSRSTAAALMTLRALTLAAEGEEGEGICLWQAAEGVEPALAQVDLSSFGPGGQLLERNRLGPHPYVRPEGEKVGQPLGEASGEGRVLQPEMIAASQRLPGASRLARTVRSKGSVVVEAVINEQGALRQLKVTHTEGPIFGFDLASLEAFCHWRFKPAQLNGRPVKVFYVMTFNLSVPPAASSR